MIFLPQYVFCNEKNVLPRHVIFHLKISQHLENRPLVFYQCKSVFMLFAKEEISTSSFWHFILGILQQWIALIIFDLPYKVTIEIPISVLNTCTFEREIKRVLSPSHCYILHVIVWQVFINPYFMVFGICLVLIFTSWSYSLMPTLYM